MADEDILLGVKPEPVPAIYCGNCRHWDIKTMSAGAHVAPCTLAFKAGMSVPYFTTDKTTCSKAEAR